MSTNSLLFLLVGIAVGWGIEAVLDYFFWHSRRNCSETERQLRTTVNELERKNALLLGQLEATSLGANTAVNGRETTGLMEVIQALALNRGGMTVNVNSDLESKGSTEGSNGRSGRALGTAIETITETRTQRDNLKVIWGIGPGTEKALNDQGIFSFRQLADMTLVNLRNLFEGDTKRSSLLNDDDYLEWRAQAALAAEGKIEALAQRKLNYSQKMKSRKDDNLQHIWGIGLKYEKELNASGIKTLRDLATAEFEKIEAVLQEIKGDYDANVTLQQVYEWVIVQAKLAANGFWGRLEGFQERFRGKGHTDDFTKLELISEEVQAVLSNDYYIRTWQQLSEIDLDAVAELQRTFSTRYVTLSAIELLDQIRSLAAEQIKATNNSSEVIS